MLRKTTEPALVEEGWWRWSVESATGLSEPSSWTDPCMPCLDQGYFIFYAMKFKLWLSSQFISSKIQGASFSSCQSHLGSVYFHTEIQASGTPPLSEKQLSGLVHSYRKTQNPNRSSPSPLHQGTPKHWITQHPSWIYPESQQRCAPTQSISSVGFLQQGPQNPTAPVAADIKPSWSHPPECALGWGKERAEP